MALKVGDDVKAALADVHQDASPTEWVVISYKSKDELHVLGSGTEGRLAAASALFQNDEAAFALIRYAHVVDKSKTSRFAFIDWTPESMKPTKKALVSTHKGQVKKLFEPIHVDLGCSDRGDVNEDTILAKIGAASGTSSAVVSGARAAELRPYSRTGPTFESKKGADFVPKAASSGKDMVTFGDAVKPALDNVRNDSSGVSWVVCGYGSEAVVDVIKSGAGDVSEFLDNLDNDNAQYGLARVSERFDKTDSVKFVFVTLIPESVKPIQRGKYSTHFGTVQKFFTPYHYEFTIGSKTELSKESIQEHIASYTGTKSHVLSPKAAQGVKSKASTAKPSSSGVKSPPKVDAKLKFVDEQVFKNALADLRNDSSTADYLVLALNDAMDLDVASAGSGGFSALISGIREDVPNFALLRFTDKIDKSMTVKFAYIVYIPSDYSPLKKARVGTMSGTIQDLLRPMHVDLFISTKDEITEADVLARVGAASGSKSAVRA